MLLKFLLIQKIPDKPSIYQRLLTYVLFIFPLNYIILSCRLFMFQCGALKQYIDLDW